MLVPAETGPIVLPRRTEFALLKVPIATTVKSNPSKVQTGASASSGQLCWRKPNVAAKSRLLNGQ
jgi:hypothetical protein